MYAAHNALRKEPFFKVGIVLRNWTVLCLRKGFFFDLRTGTASRYNENV